MKTNIRQVKKYRKFSETFKKQLVSDYESGKYSTKDLSVLYKISQQVIYVWIHKYSIFQKEGYRIVEMKESSTSKVKDLERKVKELERIVGQKQLTIDYLNTMMEVAKEELDIDIKKNFGTSPSGDSKKKSKK